MLARDYKKLLVSPTFLGFALGGGFATTSMYAFIATAPFIFVDELHRAAARDRDLSRVLIAGASLGSALASRLVRRVTIERLMVGANLVSVVGALTFLTICPSSAV